MKEFFIITAFFFSLAIVIAYKRNNCIITVYNAVYVMTLGNFYLYLLGWSENFTNECYPETYFVIGIICLLFGGYALFDKITCVKKKPTHIVLKNFSLGSLKIQVSTLLMVICILFTAIENVYNTGSLFASDLLSFHVDTMPGIGTLVRALYPVAYTSAYVDFKNKRKKITIVLFIVSIMYALLGAGSRYWPTIYILTFVFFLFKYDTNILGSMKQKYKILFALMGILLLSLFIYLGEMRTGNQTYASWIMYNGPFQGTPFGVIISWFYGYFSFSFYNLNNTLHNIVTNDVCTYGLFSLYPFLAILHITDILGVNVTSLEYECRVIVNTAATVPTGWYQFFADFKYFFGIILMIYIIITYYFEKKGSFFGLVSFAYMGSAWTLLAFNNIFLTGVYVYVIIISFFIEKLFRVKSN